jgi:transposase
MKDGAMRSTRKDAVRPATGQVAKAIGSSVDPNKKKHNGKSHDLEFKRAAAKLVSERGYTPKQAAVSLGVKVSTLQYWVKIFAAKPQQQAETLETLQLRVRELESENLRLRSEREILKKATAFFASQNP